jgi:hypothetical protein
VRQILGEKLKNEMIEKIIARAVNRAIEDFRE